MRRTWARLSFAAVLAVVSAARAEDPRPAATLALDTQVEARAEGHVHLEATFRAVGAAKVTFFVPEFFEAEQFPGWRFVREDGAEFVPYVAPFQSIWTEGMQGSLVELAGERTWRVEHDVAEFLAVGPKAGPAADLTPLPLPPGRYRATCAYAHARAEVPVGGPAFSRSTRPVAGLWTGKVESAPVSLLVAPPARVSLTIDAPRDAVEGQPYMLEVVLRNGTDKAVTLQGPLRVSASSKELGTFTADVRLGAEAPAPAAGPEQGIALEPGAARSFRVDLHALRFRGGRAASSPQPLPEALGQGIFALDASFGVPAAPEPLRSNGLWRFVQRAGQRRR